MSAITQKKVPENKNGVFVLNNIYDTKRRLKRSKKIPKLFLNKKYTPLIKDNFKPTLFGKYFNYTGILGYYNPFTSKAQFNNNLPSATSSIYFSHESARSIRHCERTGSKFHSLSHLKTV